jgi:hypothetical protein
MSRTVDGIRTPAWVLAVVTLSEVGHDALDSRGNDVPYRPVPYRPLGNSLQ